MSRRRSAGHTSGHNFCQNPTHVSGGDFSSKSNRELFFSSFIHHSLEKKQEQEDTSFLTVPPKYLYLHVGCRGGGKAPTLILWAKWLTLILALVTSAVAECSCSSVNSLSLGLSPGRQKMDFKTGTSESRRRETARLLRTKTPDSIPVVITRMSSERILPRLESSRYLFKNDCTVFQLLFYLRSKLNIKPEVCIFLVTNGVIPSPSKYLCELYEKYRNEDDILYISYGSENVFG
ncbi:Autophagy-related protein 8 [Araneus ventricosus]|uniref:Autophagy-related protein 8 n=1 Tax=Araneus ventricosus TaxID=182803 RepID=A0A4Y2ESM6_ARAVE|nr:Autophagy-related protein 8 [Araneus ventricosus]